MQARVWLRCSPSEVIEPLRERHPMPTTPVFLIVDKDLDGQSLLSRTLLRKFPSATVETCDDAFLAVALTNARKIDGIVVHRAIGVSGEDTVRQLRAVDPGVPIIMVSWVNRSDSALAAGANRFLDFDAWLMLGPTMSELLYQRAKPTISFRG